MRIALVASLFVIGLAATDQPARLAAGVYTADLPAANSPGRHLTLALTPDGRAALTLDFHNRKPPIVERGTWAADDAGRLTVRLTARGAAPARSPQVLQFEIHDDRLTGIGLDPSRWGTSGLTLARDPSSDVIGRTWRLVEMARKDGSTIAPRDPARYTLQLTADGAAVVLADCNRARGSYRIDGPHLTFGPMAITRMACPAGSLETQYLRGLAAVSSYVLEDGQLQLALKLDGGTMTFEPMN